MLAGGMAPSGGGAVVDIAQQVVVVEEGAGSTLGGNFGPPHTLQVVSGGPEVEGELQYTAATEALGATEAWGALGDQISEASGGHTWGVPEG